MLASSFVQADLDVAQPISPQIYAWLRNRIIRNDLKPGNRISESEIARECNVSRQPVREAFIKLAEQGLLLVLPQRGTVVSKIAFSAVLNARFMREAIESDFVAILANTPDASLVRELRKQIAHQRALDTSEALEFIHLDEQFHRTLADGAGKSGTWKLLEGLKSQMDRVRFLSLGQFPVGKLISQHEAVVNHIERGEPGAADAAIRLHLREILHDLPQVRDSHPDFFEMPKEDVTATINAPIKEE